MLATERSHMSTHRNGMPGGALLVQSTSAIGRCIGILCALLAAVALLLTGLVSPASAAVDTTAQCNGLDNIGGLGARCTVTVTNNLDLSTGVTSSTVVTVECHGPANTALLCVTTPTSSLNLTTTANQCNGSENGGGGSLVCDVIVVNNIIGAATAVPASIDQCIGSADSSGVAICSPLQATTNADITQCNGSGNGGGTTVTCTVTTSTNSSALPIIINQCNNSGNGGGALVTCTASITNNILPAASTTTTTPAGGVIGDVQVVPVTVPTARPGRLPATGANSGVIGLIGVVLVSSGAVVLLARRRRPA